MGKLYNVEGVELYNNNGLSVFKDLVVAAAVASTNLSRLNAYGQDLSGVNLNGLNAPLGNFTGCHFGGSTGISANMLRAICYGAVFGPTGNWTTAVFDRADLTSTDWSGVDQTGMSFANAITNNAINLGGQ